MNNEIIYIFSINALTFLAFWYDKRSAKFGHWRIPEKSLLLFSALGGSIGAVIASKILRHKTKKQPFKAILYFIILLQIFALALYANNS
jgi:uncharacterized membrane protein YsdA (DUF1294 family)